MHVDLQLSCSAVSLRSSTSPGTPQIFNKHLSSLHNAMLSPRLKPARPTFPGHPWLGVHSKTCRGRERTQLLSQLPRVLAWGRHILSHLGHSGIKTEEGMLQAQEGQVETAKEPNRQTAALRRRELKRGCLVPTRERQS